jgi:hypothetical protein
VVGCKGAENWGAGQVDFFYFKEIITMLVRTYRSFS